MGIGKSDVRIDIQYSNNLEQQKEEAIAYLENDPDIERYTVYQNGYVQSQNVEGEWEYVRVQNGDNGVFPLEYLEGKAPTEKNDLALSYLNAVDLGKKVGDAITIIYQGKEHVFNVCGIYQDITYGGKTAKAAIDFDRKDIEGYMIYLDLREGIDIDNHVTKMRTVLPKSKITPCDAFVFQTLSSVIANMNQVQGVAAVISLMLTILITVMFLQLMMAREHSAIALKKAIGFSTRDIQIQLGIRLLVIQVLAIIAGTLLANTLGEVIFGGMLATVGVAKIKLLIEPLWAYLLCPAVQLGVVVMTVIIGTNTVGSYHIRDQIME